MDMQLQGGVMFQPVIQLGRWSLIGPAPATWSKRPMNFACRRRVEDGEVQKGRPLITMDDISGSLDYDYDKLSPETTRDFLMWKVKESGLGPGYINVSGLMGCNGMFYHLQETEEEMCRIRRDPKECCCSEDSFTKVDRCFPVDAASALVQSPIVINGSYYEEDEHGLRKGYIDWPKNPNEAKQDFPFSFWAPDPETGSARRKWIRKLQWEEKCLEEKNVAQMKEIRSGGKIYVSQDHVLKCISKEYTRRCPSGHALYKSPIEQGICLDDKIGRESLLKLSGKWSYECPAGYVSGTPGRKKFDSRCSCGEC